MKNIFKFSALAAAGVAAIVSCNKVQDTAPAVKTGRTVMLTVGSESKTLLHSDGQVYWLGTDKLCVFDNSAQSFQFTFTGTSNTSPTGTFECSDYTGSTPVYAVHFDRNTIGDAGYDGTKVITGQLNAAQNFMNKKSFAKDAAFSIGKIVPDGDNYSVETMKNCFSLIKFKLINADIDTITVRGLGDEVLAGWVDVDCDKLAGDEAGFWTPNTTKGGAKVIQMYTSGSGATDGHFSKNLDYYIAVLPQTVSGLEFTLIKHDGSVGTRTIDHSITLNRGKIKALSHSLDTLLFEPDNNIVLDCTDASKFRYGNPATELVTRTNTIYNPQKGGTVLEPFDFWLEGYEDYVFHGQVTKWAGVNPPCLSGVSSSNGDPKIKLPKIDGYVLASVQITYSHPQDNRTLSVTDGTNNTFASCTIKRGDAPVTLNLTNPAFIPASDDRYLAYSSELGAKFILTYTPEGSEPEEPTEIVIKCNDASQFVDGGGNPLAARSSSIYETVTSAFDFWLNGKPEYVFNGQVSQWNKTLSAKSKTLVKLPKISGYVLKEVNITYSYAGTDRTYIVTDGTADTEVDPPYTQLGKVKRKKDTTDETKIDLTGVAASTDERYLTSPGEMCGKFILTYTKVLE